jgi:hypothetical protein
MQILARKKIDQHIARGTGCWSTTGPRGYEKCEYWKRSKTRLLFVTDSVQLIQRVPYQGSSWRVWSLQNRKTSHSHCEICRWPCATG